MAATERPQLYLITPPTFSLNSFPDKLKSVLDSADIACLRLALASRDEDEIARAADCLREIAHARDIAIVVENHVKLVDRLGLDGIHLTDARKPLRKLREEMGADAIIGAFAGISRHDGMNAAEAGADYIAFGPVGASPLGDGETAPHAIFEWWSEMIEVPVVAETGLNPEVVAELASVTDFFGIGEEIWRQEDAAAALRALIAPLG